MRFGFAPAYQRIIVLFSMICFPAFAIHAQIINSFSPTEVCQGEKVTLTGSGFTGATSVQLGTSAATNIQVVDDGTIIATVGEYSTSGPVRVGGGPAGANLSIKQSPKPSLTDYGAADQPFTNCDGNATYTLRVRNSSTVYGTNNEYRVDWGDGTPVFIQTDWPIGATLTHTYNSHGYKAVTITITPANGCVKTVSYTFYNGKNPLASFTTTNPTTGLCVPAPVEFQIGNWSANTAGTVYEVVFGDGTPNVTLTHPLNAGNVVQLLSHTYNTSSCPNVDYTARLNAKNGCFTTTYTLNQIIVRKKPTADFDVNIPPPCVNASVCLTNTTINGNSGNSCNPNSNFTWNFGDGSATVDATATCHTFTNPGTYTITLSASNAACGSDTKSKQLTILAPSAAPATSPVVYCQGQPATPLTAVGTGLRWYTAANAGTALATAPTPSTANPGVLTWYVSQTTPGNCEGPRVPITVTINALPAAPVAVSPIQLCQNAAATPLVATGTDLKWYTAATGGIGSATAPTPNTTNTGTSTYYVSQTSNGCEGPRKAIQVNVNALAVAPGVSSPKLYCQNDVATPLTATGAGLRWYDVPTGGTGSATAPTPNTSTVGSTTWYVSQVTGCGESPRAAIVVTVNARPAATIGYTPAVLCNVLNATSPNPPVAVTHTGTTGGTYSISPANGLPINSTTGELNPSGATSGNYTITYKIPGSGGCSDYTTTTTVTVNGTPTATVTYPALCSSDAAALPQITGSRGGTFTTSSPALVLDQTSGAINPAGSTPGTYEVTYTIAPNAPCPGFTTKASVTITQAPSATIAYATTVLCNVQDPAANPPLNVVFNGTTGGSYSVSPANGLQVNTTTGQINPANALPGMYTIRYTVAGSGGCRVFETTTSVTVNGAPTATIQYTNSPICSGSTALQKVTRTGTAGGSFTAAPAGLTISATTGDINPASSTPGTYTISYTIAAAAPCPGYTATTTVVINESPTISFPTPNQNICSGQSASFIPTSSVPNTSFRWSVSGQLPANVQGVTSGNSSGNTPIILSYTNSGTAGQTVTVQVIAANPVQTVCTAAPYNISVTVNPLPPAPEPDTFHLCMAAPPAALQGTPMPGTTIKWYDQANVLLAAPPVVSTAGPAQFVYNISYAFNNGCEGPKAKVLAIVHPTAKIVGSSYSHPTSCGVPTGSIVLDVVDLNNNGIPSLPVVVHYNNFNVPYAVNDNTDASGKITVPLKAGMYDNIFVETGIGCLSQKIPDVYVLKDPSPPAQPIAGYNPPICSESLLQLTALSATSNTNGPIDYVWAGPAFGPVGDTVRTTMVSFPSAPVSYAGTYIVYATQNNCISPPTTFTVAIKQSPVKPRVTTRSPLCIGDDLVLQAASAMPGNSSVIEYTWKGPGPGFPVHATTARIDDVKIEYSGIYTITAYSPQTGCSSSTDTLIQIGGYPIVKFAQDTLTLPTGFLLKLDPVVTNAADPGILPMKTFAWNPSQDIQCNDAPCSTPILTVKANACYAVKATNIYGCSGSDTICVKVFCTGAQVFVPNAFAPRGNVAENQKLLVRASGIASVRSFRVFNRWGKILFEKNNFQPNVPANGWDGYVNGRLADPGVYIYTVDVICENGVPYTYKGNVTLF